MTRSSNRLLLFFAAGMIAPSGPVWAADDPPPAARVAVLHLANGDFVPGELRGSDDAGVLRWQSPLFTQPFDFILGGVSTVHYPPPAAMPKPAGDYCFELAAGDVLFGSLVGLGDDDLELDVPRIGRLRVRRDHVRRFFPSRGDDLVYVGPNGVAGWNQPAATTPWREEGGAPFTDKHNVFLFADLKIPAQAVIEFELSWKNKPDFELALDVDDRPATLQRAFRFEVWDSDLVVHRETESEADVVSVQEIKPGAGRAHLITYLDRKSGRLVVLSPAGVQLADLKISPKKAHEYTGMWLKNKRGDIRLDRLRISRWNGVAPREVEANKSRLHRTDGSIVYGQLTAFNATTAQFTVHDGDVETRVAADQITSIFLSPPSNPLAPGPARQIRAVYQDGTQLSGTATRIDDDRLSLTNDSIREPLRLPLAELRSLVVLERPNAAPVLASESRIGMLDMNGVRLRGQLTGGTEKPDASCLVWRPEQSRTGSPLAPGATGRIVYREPPPPAPKTAAQPQRARRPAGFLEGLAQAFSGAAAVQAANPAATIGTRSLHLRTGDMIPCEVHQVDENGLRFKTPLSDATFVPHDQIKAVELAGAQSSLKLNKTKRERLLTLPRGQKGSPPTQLICSSNGDFLRGRLIDMDDSKLRVEVRLETKELARDRVSQIIWLHDDELGETKPAANPPPQAPKRTATRVQALRADGIRLTFVAEQMAGQTLSGKSDVLGACRADVSQVDQLLFGETIEKAAAELTYHKWKLHNATEPKFAQDAEGESPADRTPGTESPLVGKPAPDFELELLDGKKFHLADHKGKVVVLDFWATWCGPCLQAMPQVEKVAHEFGDEVRLVAVNLEEGEKQIAATLERHKLQVTAALDRDGVVASKYAVTAIPQTVVIDRDGNVARLFVGGGIQTVDQLRDALQTLVPPTGASQ
jgi:thiol-disulfide isomerase/thioredoxin